MRYDPETQPGLATLAAITAALTGATPQQVLSGATSYGQLKDLCTDVLVAELAPVQQRHDELLRDGDELRHHLGAGALRATEVAGTVLRRARAAMGVGTRTFSPSRADG